MLSGGFKKLLAQEVTLKSFISRDAYGKKTVQDIGTKYAARVQPKSEALRTANGLETITKVEVWLPGDVTVTADDEIVLPDGTSPPILHFIKMPDGQGRTLYTKITCGASSLFRMTQ